MTTRPHANPKDQDRPLTEIESTLVVEWLRSEGVSIRWIKALIRLRPSAVAKQYKVNIEQVISAARRDRTE